jgi:hypothetical protein
MNNWLKQNWFKIVFVLIVIIAGGVYFWNEHQKSVSQCKYDCEYESWHKIFKYNGCNNGGFSCLGKNREFPELKQCIDYCLSIVK